MRRGFLVLAVAVLWCSRAEAAPCERRVFEGSAFTLCAFDSRRDELRLVWTGAAGGALRSFARLADALGPDARRVRFAMNAGMFEESGMPLGLFVERGVVRRPLNTRSGGGNFYLKPNGVFLLARDGQVRVETSDALTAESTPPLYATQSGPMLVIDGAFNPQITADGPSRKIRNGVGMRGAHTAVFAISEEPVSFGRLARLFRDALGCRNALYLDGTISSAWIPALARQDAAAPLGPMVVVLGGPAEAPPPDPVPAPRVRHLPHHKRAS
ncbi:MAG: phosphodiester glycosidase family protein [Rhizomicrobium sp.]